MSASAWMLAAVTAAFGSVELTTDARVDSVTVGQRFRVAYRFAFPDTLTPVVPDKLEAGTCRVVSLSWSERRKDGRVERTADVTFIPVDLDSSVVPANRFAFVAPAGDTVFATSHEIAVPIRHIAAGAQDPRDLKEQWTLPPDYLRWALIGLAAAALVAALVWWIRRRRARRAVAGPEPVRLPPDFVALTELERIAAMGLVERGEFKTYYTLVVDVVRRYVEARFGIEAMESTSSELVEELPRHDVGVDALAGLLEEADLVKFAKLVPLPTAAVTAMDTARAFVIDTAPKPEPAPEPEPREVWA